jgi:hypothetical protein
MSNPNFHERQADTARIATMLEAMALDLSKAAKFLADEAQRMAKAEEKFAARVSKKS